ncbi:hypothetical protein EDD18DRAFT_1355570 [Armillaria luteobubalina]|uniref:DUF3533 domain-containing protein n=1 Tax=Armillaria luteobubalina TaxID=153913 RepID=A0AA39Q2U8_9AGAR|nr:hypothetical protein EDD18DRAFT_1355570 [Armillaria luteobubalina]
MSSGIIVVKKVSWTEQPLSNFSSDADQIINLIIDQKTWITVVVNLNATVTLQAAVSAIDEDVLVMISRHFSFVSWNKNDTSFPARSRGNPAKVLDDTRKEFIVKTWVSVCKLMENNPLLRLQRMYTVSRDMLTMMIWEESLDDNLLLNEYELWQDILQDAFLHRSEKLYSSMAELMKKAGSEILGLVV